MNEARLRKELEKICASPTNVRYEDLERVLLAVGFEKRQGSTRHAVFRMKNVPAITVPVGNPLKVVYVKLVCSHLKENGLWPEGE